MNEKVFKVFIGRLEEAAVMSYVHKNDAWQEQLDKTRESLLKNLKEQQSEINYLVNALRVIDTHIRSILHPLPCIIKTLKETLPEYNVEDDGENHTLEDWLR